MRDDNAELASNLSLAHLLKDHLWDWVYYITSN